MVSGISLEEFHNITETYRRCTESTNCTHHPLTGFASCLCDMKFDVSYKDELYGLASQVHCNDSDPDYTFEYCPGSADASFCNSDGYCDAVPVAGAK